MSAKWDLAEPFAWTLPHWWGQRSDWTGPNITYKHAHWKMFQEISFLRPDFKSLNKYQQTPLPQGDKHLPREEFFMANVAVLQPWVSTEQHQLLFWDEVTAWLPFPSWNASLPVPAPSHQSSRSGTCWDSALAQLCHAGRAVHPPPLITSRQKSGQAQPPTFLKGSRAKRVKLAKGEWFKRSARCKYLPRRQGRGSQRRVIHFGARDSYSHLYFVGNVPS